MSVYDKFGRVDHSLNHPDVFHASQPWSEDQNLHVAVAYSNPMRWRTRRTLFNNFRRHMQDEKNITLHVGEIAYGDRPFEVTDSNNPNDYQFRSVQQLWHKENILSLVIQKFPLNWNYGCYIDADFVFTRHDWALETIHQLQMRDWVQMFSSITDLKHDHSPLGPPTYGFAYCLYNRKDGYGNSKKARQGAYDGYAWPGRPGGAWAFRRDAYNRCGGLIDFCILGSGDYHMSLGIAGMKSHNQEMILYNYAKMLRTWQDRAEKAVNGRVGFINCHLIHHYHGTFKGRAYDTRWKILNRHQYDPSTDIFRDSQGLYQLTEDKPELREDIIRYFAVRNEDDCTSDVSL